MLNQIYKSATIHQGSIDHNLSKIRRIYIEESFQRKNAVMNYIYGGRQGVARYYEEAIEFIKEYGDKKIAELPARSTLRHWYSTQLPACFLLIDFYCEGQASARDLANLFGGLISNSRGDKLPPMELCFPGQASMQTFVDRRKEHYKYRGMIEMFLLRAIFDLKILAAERKYPCTYDNDFSRCFEAPAYIDHIKHDIQHWDQMTVHNTAELKGLFDEAFAAYDAYRAVPAKQSYDSDNKSDSIYRRYS